MSYIGTNGNDNEFDNPNLEQYGLNGDDALGKSDGDFKPFGGEGDDTLFQLGAFLMDGFGGPGNDWMTLVNTSPGSSLYGEDGNDIIEAGGGADTIYGGEARDALYGRGGNDTLYGGGCNDDRQNITAGTQAFGPNFFNTTLGGLYGGEGDDLLDGGAGNDEIAGGLGDDILRGGDGDDLMYGNFGNDRVFGDAVNDTMYSRLVDAVTMFGGLGDDIIGTGNADDLITGNAGNDIISAGDGVDIVMGDIGNDTLAGGAGNDGFLGGAGNDVFNLTTEVIAGESDGISDWENGRDILLLPSAYSGSTTFGS